MPIPARAIYDIIKKLNDPEQFLEFARQELKIPNHEINHLKEKYQGQPKEQKFQMVLKWEIMNGRNATELELYSLYNKYVKPDERSQEAMVSQRDVPSREGGPAIHNNQEEHPASQLMGIPNPQEEIERFLARYSTQAPSSSTSSGAPLVAQPMNLHTANNNQAGGSVQPTVTGNVSQTPGYVANYGARSSQPEAGILTSVTHQSARVVDGRILMPSPVQPNLCVEVHSIRVLPCTEEKKHQIRQENVYPMAHDNGLVVIINNNFQLQGRERCGAKKDVEHMKELWRQLGCDVILEEDKTCRDIRDILENIAKGPANYNYLAIFIMSHGGMHGDTEVVQGCDGNYMSVEEILLKFTNLESRNWIGIPKLFFFQFCRGTSIDEGLELEHLMSSIPSSPGVYDQADDIERRHTSYSDMLISYATLSGYAAYRNEKGSWFINAITNVFMQYAWEEHVTELMIRVRKAVGGRTGRTKRDGSIITCKEMSESVDRLQDKLYLLLTPQRSMVP